jgi:hypothetical protein
MVRALALVGLLASAAGCQTFIGVDDVNAHLPRLDGTYLMTISRLRQGGAEDQIRLRTLATLDHGTRTLDLEFVILDFDSDTAVAEGSIPDLEFPPESATTTVSLNLQVPDAALATPATGTDSSVVAELLVRAEAEYSFCAKPADTGQAKPTFGTVLVAPGGALPTGPQIDLDCDEP